MLLIGQQDVVFEVEVRVIPQNQCKSRGPNNAGSEVTNTRGCEFPGLCCLKIPRPPFSIDLAKNGRWWVLHLDDS